MSDFGGVTVSGTGMDKPRLHNVWSKTDVLACNSTSLKWSTWERADRVLLIGLNGALGDVTTGGVHWSDGVTAAEFCGMVEESSEVATSEVVMMKKKR